jgi:hypothetical protein
MPFAATAAERPGTLKSRIGFPCPHQSNLRNPDRQACRFRVVLHGHTVPVN